VDEEGQEEAAAPPISEISIFVEHRNSSCMVDNFFQMK
jgi:hypothetical protein